MSWAGATLGMLGIALASTTVAMISELGWPGAILSFWMWVAVCGLGWIFEHESRY